FHAPAPRQTPAPRSRGAPSIWLVLPALRPVFLRVKSGPDFYSTFPATLADSRTPAKSPPSHLTPERYAMRNNILTLLVGFLVMLGSVMLFKLGLDKMTDAGAATQEAYAKLDVDLDRKAILYRVQSGDTLWGLAERFYGA